MPCRTIWRWRETPSAGIQHFLFADFVATLVPAWIPGHYFWTYFAGSALSGLMMFLWVVLLHMPRAMTATDSQSRNEWTAVFEALAMSGIAFVLAGGAERRQA